MTLLERLEEYEKQGFCPMHMPGHKRAQVGGPLPWQLDITEIDGFDNLHGAQGILREGMDRAARLYGSDRAFYLVNGSTCGILAGICAAARPGDTVILSRGCHKSVYHALELRGLRPVYLTAPVDPTFGVSASMPPSVVREALRENPQAKLLILTSPTYEGVISDLPAMVQMAHEAGVPVLVDEAHGAHLGFSPVFKGGAVAAGADIVIQSLHKTLPSLTQTALAHWNHGLVDGEKFARQLGIFETSSPSYLLMGSIDQCVSLLEEHREEWFAGYASRLAQFSRKMEELRHLRVLCHGKDRMEDHPGFYAFDPGKLVIRTRGTNLTGPGLMEKLRKKYRIELEMALGEYGLAMTSVLDSEENFSRLESALLEIDKNLIETQEEQPVCCCPLPPQRMTLSQAREKKGCLIPFLEAEGRISGEMVWAYPPGIPLLVPGEEVTKALMEALEQMERTGVALHGERGNPPKTLWVLAE